MARPHDVTGAADKVEGNPVLQGGARVGYAVSGVLHLLIGWIALQVAWSGSGKSADQSGALRTLAGTGPGRLTLWVAVVGFVALGLWQLAYGLATRPAGDSSPWAARAKGVAKAVLYLALAWTCFSTARGQPSSSKAQSADFTATLLQHTGGRLLVSLIGLAVIGVGGYHVVKGWTRKFLQDLRRASRHVRNPRRDGRLHRQGHRPGGGRAPVRCRGGAELVEQGHRTGRGVALAGQQAVGPLAPDRGRPGHRGVRRVQLRACQVCPRLNPLRFSLRSYARVRFSVGAADPHPDRSAVGVVDEVVQRCGPGPREPWQLRVVDRAQPARRADTQAPAVIPALQPRRAVGERGERLLRVVQVIQVSRRGRGARGRG